MAWEDRTPFDAIEAAYGLNQNQVEDLMRRNLKKGSYTLWRKRARGRKTKHAGLHVLFFDPWPFFSREYSYPFLDFFSSDLQLDSD